MTIVSAQTLFETKNGLRQSYLFRELILQQVSVCHAGLPNAFTSFDAEVPSVRAGLRLSMCRKLVPNFIAGRENAGCGVLTYAVMETVLLLDVRYISDPGRAVYA